MPPPGLDLLERLPRVQTSATDRARVACDSFVVLAERTRAGHTIFAKNSDRPAGECQPLKQIAAADHPPGSLLRCQYIEIDQVAHTYGILGAGPHWLWGLEHGLNQCGVAVGNHTIFTRDPVADTGLQGMDLVRLALERAASAEQAIEVLTALIERHGQGGSGYLDTHWPYHNSFLVAGAERAFLLEASANRWALREVHGAGSASNHTAIGADWDRLSHDCAEHARAQGWWDGQGRLDFSCAYRDASVVPPVISSGRFERTCRAAAEAARAGLDPEGVRRLMRDHYETGTVYQPGRTPDDERYYSLCMHADPVGTTTASMVVELRRAAGVPVYWAALSNPCIGPFLPLFPQGKVPDELLRGSGERDGGGAWWRFQNLLEQVEADPEARGPLVREFWDAWEADWGRQAERLRAQLERELAPDGHAPSTRESQAEPSHAEQAGDGVHERTSAFMESLWNDARAALEEIGARVRDL